MSIYSEEACLNPAQLESAQKSTSELVLQKRDGANDKESKASKNIFGLEVVSFSFLFSRFAVLAKGRLF
jgi:hypothetical protein